jgi:hypothetical protein
VDLGVGESQDASSEVFDDGSTFSVVVREPFMLSAVQFDHEFCCVAVEVSDVSIERNLAAKLRAVEA